MWLQHCRSINSSQGKGETKEKDKGEERDGFVDLFFLCPLSGHLAAKDAVHLIAAGPLGYRGRRLAGRTWDSPAEYQPCRCWWSVPLHSQTASCRQNAPIARSHFSTLWSEYVHWEVCPWVPIPSESQNWIQVTLAAGMFLTLVASSSCLSVPGRGIPVCTSLLLQLDHEAPGAHLQRRKKNKKGFV